MRNFFSATNGRAQKLFPCAGIFLFGFFIFLIATALAPPEALADVIDPATCASGDTCATNCSCCTAQTVSCPAGSAKTYDICLDANGVQDGASGFCAGSAPNPAQCVGAAAGSTNCFRCFASENPQCNSISSPINISDPSQGTFNYSCSACVLGAPAPPPTAPEALPSGPQCTVFWQNLPSNPTENTSLSITVRGQESGAGWGGQGYQIDNGPWNQQMNTDSADPPQWTFTINSGAAGPHSIAFGICTQGGECGSPVVCTLLAPFTTQAAAPVVVEHFNLNVSFQNPLTATNLTDLLSRLLNILLIFSGALILLMIVWAAFLFVTSGGVPQRALQARDALVWAVIGFGIIILARAILSIIITILPFG